MKRIDITIVSLLMVFIACGVNASQPAPIGASFINSKKPIDKVNPYSTSLLVGILASIGGNAIYYKNLENIINVIIKLSGEITDSAFTDTVGFYKFKVPVLKDYSVVPTKQDTNLTGISAYDASLILRYSSGKIVFDSLQKIAADASGNGQVTSYDASMILRRIVGKITAFPAGAWKFDPPSRSYTGLNYAAISQNYSGMKVGDPSGNWSSKGEILSGGHTAGRSVVRIEDTDSTKIAFSIKKSEAFIKLKEINKISSLSMTVKYNDDNISINEVISLQDGRLLDWKIVSPGVFKIAFAGQEVINPEENIIRIKFSNKSDDEARFSLSYAELDESMVLVSGEFAEGLQAVPVSFGLSDGYPNPFSNGTTIRYQVASRSKISLKIYDVSGRQIRNLINKEMLAGFYSVAWNGKGNYKEDLAGGVYFLDFEAKSLDGKATVFKKTRKLLLLK